jgi:hypothetical protein
MVDYITPEQQNWVSNLLTFAKPYKYPPKVVLLGGFAKLACHVGGFRHGGF